MTIGEVLLMMLGIHLGCAGVAIGATAGALGLVHIIEHFF
jgi:hypothetical protein